MLNCKRPRFLDREIAQTVRRKKSSERSTEELQWVSLDCRLHPEIYGAGFQPHADFDLKLTQEDLYRLLVKTPKVIHHALGFIRNSRELQAHYLLHTFYRIKEVEEDDLLRFKSNDYWGYTEEDSITVDISSIADELISTEILDELEVPVAEDNSVVTLTASKVEAAGDLIVYNLNQFENIHMDDSSSDNHFFVLENRVRLLERSSSTIDGGKKHSCSFIAQSSSSRKLAGFTITIIFQGTFILDEYKPGYLSASLSHVNKEKKRIIVGESKHNFQVVNCDKNLGRLVISYEPGIPVEDAKFEIMVEAFSQCHYRLIVTGKIMVPIEDHLINELNKFRKNKKEIEACKTNVSNLKLDKRVLQRKIELLESLLEAMDQDRIKVEHSIDIAEYKMENDDLIIDIEGDRAEGECKSYFEQNNHIKDLEKKYGLCCRVLTLRKELMENAAGLIDNVNKEVELQENNIEKLDELNNVLRKDLSPVYERVCDSNLASLFRSMLKDKTSKRSTGVETLDSQWNIEIEECSFAQRSRACLREIDRIENEEKQLVQSCMLHATPQLFPKDALLVELRRLLDTMLHEIIKYEEVGHPLILRPAAFDDDDDDSFLCMFDSETRSREVSSKSHDEESAIDDGICCACGTNPCSWKSSIDYPKLLSRREELTSSILKLKKQRHQSVSMAKVSDINDNLRHILFDQTEKLREASIEAYHTDNELQLYLVDKELHDVYNHTDSRYFVTRALHKYECLMDTNDAIYALEREQDSLVGKIAAKEVISGVVDWMDRGWYFGQPSCPPVEEKQNNEAEVPNRLSQQEKVHMIHCQSDLEYNRKEASWKVEKNSQMLNRTESSIKLCLLSLIIRYFQACNSFKTQKSILCGHHDLLDGKKVPSKSLEMLAMEDEERNAKKKVELVNFYNEKARRGFYRIQKRREYEESSKVQKVNSTEDTILLRNVSSINIQKFYRGHIGRKAASRWKFEIESVRAWHALCHASAIAISRSWRGYKDRAYCADLKMKLTKYIIDIRRAEVQQDEDEYWDSLKFGKHRRKRYEKKQKKLLMRNS